MPELPEVETMRRGIACVTGAVIEAAERCRCSRRPIEIGPHWRGFRRRVEGRTITSVERVGKRVLLMLDEGVERIVIEPRMTGLVLLAAPPTREHLRLRLHLKSRGRTPDRPAELLYWDRRGLGLVRVVDADEFGRRYGDAKLGPDALLATPEMLRDRLCASRRAIKVALLDQRAVAGIGNLYASEMLHRASIHPAMPCSKLRSADWELLSSAALEVLNDAIRYEGSTLSDGTYRNALNRSGGYQNHHRVYDRAGNSCPTCGAGVIERIVQSQRSTFYCPMCQPARKPR